MRTSLETILQELSIEDQDTAAAMLGVIIAALSSGQGTVIVLADPLGDGNAVMSSGGSELLTPMLLGAAYTLGEKMYGRPEGVGVQ